MQRYDITKLSDTEAQIAGYAIEKYFKRILKKLENSRENLSYCEENSGKYGMKFWKESIEKETQNINKLIEEKYKVGKILSLIREH